MSDELKAAAWSKQDMCGDVNMFAGINRMDSEQVAKYFFESGYDYRDEEIAAKDEEILAWKFKCNDISNIARDEVEMIEGAAKDEIEKLKEQLKVARECIAFYSVSENYGYSQEDDDHVEWISDEENQRMGKKAKAALAQMDSTHKY
jgi:peptide subunit release factor RF-3